jgi:hypothetical protein
MNVTKEQADFITKRLLEFAEMEAKAAGFKKPDEILAFCIG